MITANTLSAARTRLLRMHHASGVGHIGGNLSAIDAMLLVFHEFLGPRDRFLLSKGHAAGALYIALWSVGRLSDSDLETFHKDATLLAGHPPAQGIPDIAFATGSLGHGLSLAAGTALAWRLQGRRDRVFCLTSDGEWQEGSTLEALVFSQHHRLANLTVLVDHNNLQGFGSTAEVASMSPLWERLRGFDVDIDVVDGHDLTALRQALDSRSERTRVIVMRTVKGRGVDFMENRMEWHYLPLDAEQHARAQAGVGPVQAEAAP
jgi:transketolase